MPKLQLPEEDHAGIQKVLELSDDQVKGIRASLEREAELGGRRSVLAIISKVVPDARTAEALRSLYALKSSADVTSEELAEDVCDAFSESMAEPLSPDQRARLKGNLSQLLDVKAMTLVAKAVDLQTDDERVFCSARILTDIRPVFGPDVAEGPQGAVVVHLLKLGYDDVGRGERHHDFYVSLDSEDLTALRKVIDRAEEKAKALKSRMSAVRYLGRS